jgi:hypothetical protein
MVTLKTIKELICEEFNITLSQFETRGHANKNLANALAAYCIIGVIEGYKSHELSTKKFNRTMVSYYIKNYRKIRDVEFHLKLNKLRSYLEYFKYEDVILSSGRL